MRLVAVVFLSAAPAMAFDLPPAGGGYDSQLGGAYDPPWGVTIVSRDRTDPPAMGLYNICYINAFQTQPGDTEEWIAARPDKLLQQDGAFVRDANWPDEILLNTGSAQNRDAIFTVLQPMIAECAAAGYDAVEADNLDSYTRSGGLIGAEDNLALAELLIAEAHRLGMAFGQKNSAELGSRAKEVGFDFAIAESCQVYDECGLYADQYGPHVLQIEYTDTPRAAFLNACARGGSVVLRDRDLVPQGHAAYHFEACPPT